MESVEMMGVEKETEKRGANLLNSAGEGIGKLRLCSTRLVIPDYATAHLASQRPLSNFPSAPKPSERFAIHVGSSIRPTRVQTLASVLCIP